MSNSLNTTLTFSNPVNSAALFANRAEFVDSSGQLWTPQPMPLTGSGAVTSATYTITAGSGVSTLTGMTFKTLDPFGNPLPNLHSYFFFGGNTSPSGFSAQLGMQIVVSGTYTPKGSNLPGNQTPAITDTIDFIVTPNSISSSAFLSFQVMFTAGVFQLVTPDPQIVLEGNG